MPCRNCGAELIAGKPFCHVCGTRVTQTCPNCGAQLQDGFRFCPDCGTSIAPAPNGTPAPPEPARPVSPTIVAPRPASVALQVPEDLAQKIRQSKDAVEGERKQVTVMFCDIAGSTALAEKLDPEEYHELLEQYLELAFRAVYRYEGLVNQLAGDGFMALFGAPVAHEDAPQRAVHAALQIQHSLATLNTRLETERGLMLRARIGIHTGPVVVGSVGNDLKMDYSAIGDTTNLAARLEARAQPGSVLVSEATYRLIRGRFDVRQLGPLTVKGKREPVTAYEILDLTAAARQEPSAPLALSADRALTPFVGRDAELAQLMSCYERLHDAMPQLVTIMGPAGSGKSRLLYEFKERLREEPVSWFEVRCSAWTQMLPYAPFTGMLRRYFDVMPDDPPEHVRDKVAEKVRPWDPQLDGMFPWLCRILSVTADNAPELSDEEMKRGTFEAMGALIQHTTELGPAIMLIEDLHWMDDPSREMLYAAAAQMFAWPFMILVSHRPDFHPVWLSPPVLTQLNLRRLSDDSINAIMHSVASGRLPEDLERRIREKAEGSPFLAEEVTRALMEDGTVTCDANCQRITLPVEEIRIPGTVQEVIAARLDRLSATAKRVVQVAAVMGRQFSRTLLIELLRDEGIDVDHELEELERRGVVHRRNIFSKDEYRFGESLTQEVAYEGLLLRQRRLLHERIGSLLETSPGPGDTERSALLVHHFGLSDNRAKNIQALLRSAVNAEKVPSYTTAARRYRQAWDIATAGIEKTKDPTLLRLALQAVSGIGRMAVIYNVDDPGDNGLVFSQARTLAEEIDDYGTLAGLHTYEGMLLMQRGRSEFRDGLATIEQGLELARRASDPLPSITISRALAYGYMLDGRLELAMQTFKNVLDQLEKTGHAQRLADIYCGTRWMLDRTWFYADDFTKAEDSVRETLALATRAGNRTVRSSSTSLLGHIAFLHGDYVEALRWQEEALSVIASMGLQLNATGAAAVALLASLALGRTDGTRRYIDLIAQHTMPSNDLALAAHFITEALLAAGEVEFAQRRAEMAYERAGGRLRELQATVSLADVYTHSGPEQWPEASRFYDHGRSLAETLGIRSAIAHIDYGSANLAAARGNTAEALSLLQRAAATWRQLGVAHYLRQSELRLSQLSHGNGASQLAAD